MLVDHESFSSEVQQVSSLTCFQFTHPILYQFTYEAKGHYGWQSKVLLRFTTPPQLHADYSYSDGQSPSWRLGPVNARLPPVDWEMSWLLFPDHVICSRHSQQHLLILIHKLFDYGSLFRPRQSPSHSPHSLIKRMMTSQLSRLSFLKNFALLQVYESSCGVTVISMRS